MSFLNTLVVHLVLADSINQANGHLEQEIVLVRLAGLECAFSAVFLVVLIQFWLAETKEVVVSFRASADRCSRGVTLNECPRGSNEIDLDIVELGVDDRLDGDCAFDLIHGRVDLPAAVEMDSDLRLSAVQRVPHVGLLGHLSAASVVGVVSVRRHSDGARCEATI